MLEFMEACKMLLELAKANSISLGRIFVHQEQVLVSFKAATDRFQAYMTPFENSGKLTRVNSNLLIDENSTFSVLRIQPSLIHT